MDLLTHVVTESARFAEVLAAVDPAARVPSCPDWSAGDLAWHLTEVHSMWATVVRERLQEPEPADAAVPPRPGTHTEVLALYDRVTAELVDALRVTPDDVAVWTWAEDDQRVGFVRRFQAHEALMHRVDAELSAGTLTPLPTDLAADGVDVVLRYSMTWRPDWAPFVPTGGVAELLATDTGSHWLVALGTWGGTSPNTGKVYEDQAVIELVGDATPTFTASATAEALDAWLWNRPGFGTVTTSGDTADIARFRAQLANGVQ